MDDPTASSISTGEENTKSENGGKRKEDVDLDPDFLSCLLQPSPPDSDPNYIGIRRLLLHRKAQAGQLNRKGWKCNGRGYVAYRNYINRPRNWENTQTPSQASTPGHSGRWVQSPSPLFPFYDADSWSTSRDFRSSRRLSRSTSLSSNASDPEHPRKKVEPAYSFVGMHCIFDQAKAMVTVIKFGHMSSDLLAYGAADGSLTVCTVSMPPSVLQQLTGHTKDVTDFDFSANNQYIASASIDKTVRVWDISKGLCIRVIYGVSSQLCIRFHPVNNNFLSVGNANKEILVFNFSTGRTINKSTFYSEVTAMDHDHTGQLIFCGDAQGCLYTVTMDSRTGALSRTHRHRSKSKHPSPITTVQYRTFSLLARGPVLLTFSQDGSLSFFSVSLEVQGYLTIRCALKLTPRLHSIRASFCPLLSLEKGEYIVAGSEDTNVYFYDLTRPKHACVNKLQGHAYPVIGIAWNHGENLLASSDFGGTVIVWKREKTH
ncbi:Transducin/WD40 repeat-like superfamily protein [Perilla frutescens var. hirtella]|uniref:Transducin/WD40 repeat-like superfamily protein n=1 Tax=Perilla frutescens var. hirtella TaxID=608512 RepID=A0AAD4NZ39_PERFH|nr:Transducin/WD40 repeat-like superfamily protein [Perilla frutescens var. hirtella]KAH6820316.1 Transducin/WD40 repeat-like superfamily protein [Perilla frutescens var. hirtella]